jgi:hypothetical protein
MVYTSTALQIGLMQNENVPNLIPFLLPRVHNTYCARFLRRWIVNPPPYQIAQQMQKLCFKLSTIQVSLPQFSPISLGKIVSLLDAKEGNRQLFIKIAENVRSLNEMILNSNPEINQFVPHMESLTSFESGIEFNRNQISHSAQYLLHSISSVIANDQNIDDSNSDGFQNVPDDFFSRNENEIRCNIRPDHPQISKIYSDLNVAANSICIEIRNILKNNENLVIVHDVMENSLVFQTKKSSNKVNSNLNAATIADEFIKYIDRKGAVSSSRKTTKQLQLLLSNYLSLVEELKRTISKILKDLCELVNNDLITVIQVCKSCLKILYFFIFSSRQLIGL